MYPDHQKLWIKVRQVIMQPRADDLEGLRTDSSVILFGHVSAGVFLPLKSRSIEFLQQYQALSK